MNTRYGTRTILSGVGILVLIGLFLWHIGRASKTAFQAVEASPSSSNGSAVASVHEQISLKSQTKEAAVKSWLSRIQEDQRSDWKTPIEFYGRVVDANGLAVNNATANLQWTDLSPSGSTKTQIQSDANGMFSLKNVQGKRLTVRIEKEGYYSPYESAFKTFEFANPGEAVFYEPDATSPVIFHLIKKEGEPLALERHSLALTIPTDGAGTTVDLLTGKVSPNGQFMIRTSKPWPPRPITPHYNWSLSLSIRNGGLIETDGQSPVEAPDAEYSPTMSVQMTATSGERWKVSINKNLYFVIGEPKKFGRLNIRTSGNSRAVFVDYVFNPSGSRNLGFDVSNETSSR